MIKLCYTNNARCCKKGLDSIVNGIVKNFNKEKGFGFITNNDGKDIFFHYSELQVEGFKTIDPQTEVNFDVVETEKGLRAVNITVA